MKYVRVILLLVVFCLITWRTAYAQETRRIVVVGDSIADGIWGALFNGFLRDSRYKIYQGSAKSTGLTRTSMIAPLELAFSTGRVDAVVICVGANDTGMSVVEGGRIVGALGTPSWHDAYAARVRNYMQYLTLRNVPAVWILPPAMRAADANAGARRIEAVIRDVGFSYPNVLLLSTFELTTVNGVYNPNMRFQDGVHFDGRGYKMMADGALKLLRYHHPNVFLP